MRFILLAALLLAPTAFATPKVVIDQNFCETRALLSKMSMEGRKRGESSEEAKRDIQRIVDGQPADSIVRAVAPLGLLDVDTVFLSSPATTPLQAYIRTHDSCRDQRGRYVSL